MSCLISEVTTGASGVKMEVESCTMITSSVGLTLRVPSTARVLTKLSSAPRLIIKSVAWAGARPHVVTVIVLVTTSSTRDAK